MAALSSIAALLFVATNILPANAPDTLFVEQRAVGSFQQATRLAVSPQGWIYVIDAERNAVFLLNDSDSAVAAVGGYGWTATTFDRPTGLATDGLNVYVSDYNNHRIQRFDRFLNFVSSFSTRDTDVVAARFGYPLGIALSRLGDMFVLDGDNSRVVKFVRSAVFERSFGGIDDQRGKVELPTKILVGSNDHVYVLEQRRLLEYDYFGNYMRTIGLGVLSDARGFDVGESRIVVAAKDTLYWFSDRGDLFRVTPTETLFASMPLSPLEDVALVRDRLYLLTAKRLFVFKIVPVGG
jgi:DNA-binding beta-propeller fold protein YncE